jgi:hypothetical protein
MTRWVACGAIAFAAMAGSARADVTVSGLADFVLRNRGEDDLVNTSFGGQSPFDPIRIRLFFDANVSDNTSVFVQFLTDEFEPSLYGAYARFENIAGSSMGVQAGLIPNTVAAWGERTYSDKNPLIGIPLMQVHHTALMPYAPQATVDELLEARDMRSQYGLPLLYDNCWNTGLEVFSTVGEVDLSAAMLSGSVTEPTRTQEKDIPQGTAKVSWSPSPAWRVGVSGFYGPYFVEGMVGLDPGQESQDFPNSGVVGDFYWGSRWVDVYAEGMICEWQHPQLPDLTASSAYGEVKYKFMPKWYVAGRFDFIDFGEVTDSTGREVPWDYPVSRIEYGIGFKPRPRVILKAVGQHNRFEDAEQYDSDHYAGQLSLAF